MILSQDNYFELFGIDENATERDIRLAYTKMLRKYPHEQYPEEFQLLLKAKDTLLDPEAREKYIKSLKNGGLHDLLVEKTIAYYNDKNFSAAYDTVKKLLKETNEQDPEILVMASTITGELGYNQERQKYIQALERNHASLIDVKRHLSTYYSSQKMYSKAITYAKQVTDLDASDLNEIIFLIDLYRMNDQYDKAKAVVKSNLNKELKLHDYVIIEVGLFIASNEDDRPFAKELVKKLKTLAIGTNKREILRFLANTVEEIDDSKYAFKFLISLVEEINNKEYDEFTDWVKEAKRYIQSDRGYFELEETYSQPSKSQSYNSQKETSYQPKTSVNTEPDEDFKWKGSLVWAIIFGIFAWIGSESFGTGAIVALVWYFLGGLIKGLMGCLIIILVILAVGAMFFG